MITPDASMHGLNPKYKVNYDRLRISLQKQAALKVSHYQTSNAIWDDFVEPDFDQIPTELYLDELVQIDELSDSRSEVDGTIWFISLLSRVDGLVLLTQDLEVKGFGVEITVSEEPSEVFSSRDHRAAVSRLRRIDYNHYGTRHRSMMRYCASVPGSVGIVISQDGDVRVFTKFNGRLVMWEDIKLRVDDDMRPITRTKRKPTP